jgi:Ca-activated chloride channel family protein
MWGQVEGKPKIEIARTVMGDMLGKLPADVQAGLMVYLRAPPQG